MTNTSHEIREYYSTVTQERGLFYTEEAAALFPTLKQVPSKRLADADPIEDVTVKVELEHKPASKTTKDGDN